MNDRKAGARRWFDRRAASYEAGVTSRWRDPVQRASLDALHLGAEDRLLDVGCGTGAASRSAALIATSVVGIDLSPEMIREARALVDGLANVHFEIADSEHLPFGIQALGQAGGVDQVGEQHGDDLALLGAERGPDGRAAVRAEAGALGERFAADRAGGGGHGYQG